MAAYVNANPHLSPDMRPVPKLSPGDGRITLTSYGSNAILSELASTYPLKLISPLAIHDNVAVVYSLSFGGGLVGGDSIALTINVDTKSILVLRSQGSTKVFQSRPERRLASVQSTPVSGNSSGPYQLTKQTMIARIANEGAIFLLPDPVTCFRSASYAQKQTFYLSEKASLLVLDWWTSGRSSMGEEWVFTRYHSINDIWVEGKRVAKDVTLLHDSEPAVPADLSVPPQSMAERLAPYSCYATVILLGPLVLRTIRHITSEYNTISILKETAPADVIWSLSPLADQGSAIIRVAGKETELVKKWLASALTPIEEIVGTDVYRSTFLS